VAQDKYTSSVRAEAPTELQATDIKYAIQSSQALEARLDRLSGFIYKDLEKEAERMGLRYGVTNRPSLEQIAKAVERGEDPNQAFHAEGTVFGDAAHKAQSELLKQDLEYNFVNELQRINQAIDAGADVDVQMLGADLQTKIDAQAKILSTIDPSQMASFRAGMTLKGNAVYNNALANQVLRINAENLNKAENMINMYGVALEDMLIDTDGNMIDAHALLTPDAKRVSDLADRVPKEKAKLLEKFDLQRQLAYKGAIKKYLSTHIDHVPEGSHLLLELEKGNLGKMSNVYAALDQKTQDELQKEIIAEYTNRNTLNEAMQKELEFNNNKKITDIYLDRASGKMSGLQAIDKLEEMGIKLSKSEVDSLIKPIESTNDTIKNAIYLKRKILYGGAGLTDIMAAASNQSITWNDAKALTDDYNSMTNYARRGLNRIRVAMGVNEFNDMSLIPRFKREAIDRLTNQLLAEASAKGKAGIAFDDEAYANILINDFQKSQDIENIKQAVDAVQLAIGSDQIKIQNEQDVMKLWQGNDEATRKLLRDNYDLNRTQIDAVMSEINLIRGYTND
jgi:hypothetical protein